MNSPEKTNNAYWRSNLTLTGSLLSIWFVVSFGCGILFKEHLDQFSIGGGASWFLDGPTRFHHLFRFFTHCLCLLHEQVRR